jgi:hypothetical protein
MGCNRAVYVFKLMCKSDRKSLVLAVCGTRLINKNIRAYGECHNKSYSLSWLLLTVQCVVPCVCCISRMEVSKESIESIES